MGLKWTDHDEHQGFRITAERGLQEVRKLDQLSIHLQNAIESWVLAKLRTLLFL